MPTYEYACEACGHRFEEFHSIKAKPITKCPKCGKRKVKRLISAGGGFIFKGSGFYLTDYRSDNYKAAAKADTAPAPAESAKADGGKVESTKVGATAAPATKSEGKSEVKAESKPVESKGDAKPAGLKAAKPRK